MTHFSIFQDRKLLPKPTRSTLQRYTLHEIASEKARRAEEIQKNKDAKTAKKADAVNTTPKKKKAKKAMEGDASGSDTEPIFT